jgi:MATE family multidrug resistance protein
LIAVAAFQFFDAIAMMISGALRGAGDTVWPGIATLILSWTCIVGGGYALVMWAPQLESLGPWIAAAIYIAALCLALSWRFATGRWKAMSLVKDGPLAAAAIEPGLASAATTDGV